MQLLWSLGVILMYVNDMALLLGFTLARH